MTPNGYRIRIPSNANLRIAVRFPKLSTLPKSIEQNSQLVEPAKAIECWILHFFVRTSHSPGNHMLFVDFGNLHLNSITIRVGYVLFYAHMTRKSIGKSKLSCQRNVALFATEKLYAIRNLSNNCGSTMGFSWSQKNSPTRRSNHRSYSCGTGHQIRNMS